MKYNHYYPGNKNIPGLIQKIINQIPVCSKFYEPFAGSAAVTMFLSMLPMGPVQFFLNDLDPAVTDRFLYPAGCTVTNKPALDIIQSLISSSAGKDTFVFIDPPYTFDTRPNSLKLYNFDMSSEDHIQLLKAVRDLECNCMIIHPKTNLYDQVLQSFRTVQIKIRYHSKTSIENLYMNYDTPGILQSYAVVGCDCWDRQRIKRKGERLVQKLLALPEMERNYILSKLSSTFKND